MIADSFLDTNILVYAASSATPDHPKRTRALELVNSENFGTSGQVLQEFYVTVVRKASTPLKPAEALNWIEQFAHFPCQPITDSLVRIAIEYSVRFHISYWDAAIVAAADALGASVVYTEDLNHGQLYGRVSVINPFR